MTNIVSLLPNRDNAALIEPNGSTIGFSELRNRIEEFSGGLWDLGLRPGDRVVLLVPMGIDLYVALLGLFHLGATAVLIDPSAPVETILSRFRPVAMIGSGRAHLLRLKLRTLRGLSLYISTEWTPLPHWRMKTIQGTARSADPGSHPALLTFTTGTTGNPKAIARSHDFLLAQHRVLSDHMALGSNDIDMPTLPVFLLHSLAGGATCVLADADLQNPGKVDPNKIINQVRREGITSISGSPAFFAPLAKALVSSGETLPSIRQIFTGGARVPAGLLQDLKAALPGAALHVVYGSTEAEPIAVLDAVADLADLEAGERAGAGALVGTPVPHIEIYIDENDEILVTGEHVNKEYCDDPAADARCKVHRDGRIWHRTGDAGTLDERGRLWLIGRAGEQIDGKWPLQIEARAERLEFVLKAGLAKVNQQALLAVVLVEPPEDACAQLEKRCGVAVRVIDAMPTDPRHNAKIDRPKLEAMLALV